MDQFINPNKTFNEIDQEEQDAEDNSNTLLRRRREIKLNVTQPKKKFTISNKGKVEGHVDADLPDPSQLQPEYRVKERIYVQLAELTHEELKPLGHEFDESLLACSFRGVDCLNFTAFWHSFWHYKYGNCYVFNSGRDRPVLRSTKAGPLHGIEMQLYVKQEEYVDQLSQEAGYRIVISPQGEMPFPFEEGISVAPGQSMSIGIRKVVIKRADPFKNGSCGASRELRPGNLYRSAYNAKYSAMACRESCLAYNQLFRCGCLEYRFPEEGFEVCDSTNKTIVNCLRRLHVQYQNNGLNCSKACPISCNEEHYKTSSSSAAWPFKNYEIYLKKMLNIEEESSEILRQEMLKVKIFYEELNYQEIEENVSYDINDFLSDIGGQLGLWLGVSVLTGVEVIELILMIFLNCWQPKKKAAATDIENHEMRAKVGEPHKHPFGYST
ncbi:amiloride-sensitive sodium channel subunit gamma-2-like [Actinia tenebrosa]|uniref:Amiloride-sensitive sodium channel subunit gamma-2-like n=1 Tax=Actinia tenebrosa TaxID=6105 RepID=A0A6P8J9X7_ACTTE|nr:amiloride-sensitive sodium channel subunit gamma-2-like [Actinia tenebrosa]